MEFVRCGSCRKVLDEPLGTSVELRSACPTCGSSNRFFGKETGGAIQPHGVRRFKARHGGEGRPFYEGFVGADWSHKFQRWMRLERIIDRENDRYRERVSDPRSGETVHECEEPLNEHLGHGTDGKKRPTKAE